MTEIGKTKSQGENKSYNCFRSHVFIPIIQKISDLVLLCKIFLQKMGNTELAKYKV